MPPSHTKLWATDPEYIDLLNFLIERTKNVESPMSIKGLAIEFKRKSATTLTMNCLRHRIKKVGAIIPDFKNIDKKTKMKMIFAFSASVNPEFLEELKKDAFVEVDDKQRITHYKSNDGRLELRGDHSRSAKTTTAIYESKGSIRSWIINFFETKDDSDAVPKHKKEKEMGNLIEFIFAKCDNVDRPLRISRLAEDFIQHFEISTPLETVGSRIERYGLEIQSMEFINTRSIVQQMFGLSATLNLDCLEKLRKNALVEVDEKNRIVFYKANDGCLELRGDQSLSAKTKSAQLESKRSHQKLIRNYFEKKKNSDAVPENKEEKIMWNLIEFITEKCENVKSPLSICRLATEFSEQVGITIYSDNIRKRIKSYCCEIQKAEFLDTQTSVKQLFGLSATVNSDYLEKLRKDAHVEVDEENRISYYKANNGSLEMRGDHNHSAKVKNTWLESKRSFRSLIHSYFEKKNDADTNPTSEEEKEMWNFIELITENCENVNSPLNITQLNKDFNMKFGLSRSLNCIQRRIRRYCHEIQMVQFLNTPSKVKQLFGLSATLDSNFLKELRKDADIEVDNLNRITNYTAHSGRLNLYGDHSQPAKNKLRSWNVRRKSKKTGKKHSHSGGDENEESERENEYSGDDSDEYSSEELDSELDSDEDNNPLEKTENLTEPSNDADGFNDETPVRNRSPTGISIADNFDFDPPAERGEDQENDFGIMGNTSVKTRYGRLSKRRHLDTEFSYNLASSRSLGVSMNTDSAASKPVKQKKMKIDKEQASNSFSQTRSSSRFIKRSSRNSLFSTFSTESEENIENQEDPEAEGNPPDYHGPRNQEIEDFDYHPREDNTHESSSIDDRHKEPESSPADNHNTNIDAQNTDNRADAVAPELHSDKKGLTLHNETNSTTQSNGKEVISQEVPIKAENEEPIIAEHPTEEVKPETAHNSKMKFFEAMQSMILFLDSPSLSNLQSKIHQKIRKMKGSKEVLQNNELIPALELLIARMTNHSVIDISKGVKSVSLIQFFCYLKASLLNSKTIGVEGLMNNISGIIEKSQNKRIPMEKVVNALRATLDFDKF